MSKPIYLLVQEVDSAGRAHKRLITNKRGGTTLGVRATMTPCPNYAGANIRYVQDGTELTRDYDGYNIVLRSQLQVGAGSC